MNDGFGNRDVDFAARAPKKRSSLPKAFAFAFRGIGETFRGERNIKIQLCFAVAAVILGLALHIDAPSWLAVVICIAVVFSLEILNSALEAIVDLASPGYHELARKAKDCAAGAVLVSAIASLVVAFIVYLPPFMALFV